MDSFMSIDDSDFKHEVAELNAATSAFSSPLGKRKRADDDEESALPVVDAPGAWSPVLSSSVPRRSPRGPHPFPRVAAATQQVTTTIRRVGGTIVSLHDKFSGLLGAVFGWFRTRQPPVEIVALDTDESRRKRRAIAQMPSSPSNLPPPVDQPAPNQPAPPGRPTLQERFDRIERNRVKRAAEKEAAAAFAKSRAAKPKQDQPSQSSQPKKPAPVGLEPFAKKMQRMKKSHNRSVPRTAAEKDANLENLTKRAHKLTLTPLVDQDVPPSAKKDDRVTPEVAPEATPEEDDDDDEYAPPPAVTPTPEPEEPQLIQPISQEWEDKLAAAMETNSQTKSLAQTAEGVDLTAKDFATILGSNPGNTHASAWLNDEMVNGFFAAIVEQKKAQIGWVKGTTAPFAAFNTSWYSNVKNKGVAGIKTWSRRKQINQEKLLKAEKVFFPFNSGAHWELLIVSPQTKEIEVLDSMHGNRGKYFKLAREWLAQELGKLYVDSEWTNSKNESCTQDNMDDCGAFTCWNGLASAKGLPYSQVTAEKMQDARRMMGAILLNGGFTGDFEL